MLPRGGQELDGAGLDGWNGHDDQEGLMPAHGANGCSKGEKAVILGHTKLI